MEPANRLSARRIAVSTPQSPRRVAALVLALVTLARSATATAQLPRFTSIVHIDGGVQLEWEGAAGQTHRLQQADAVSGRPWQTVFTVDPAATTNRHRVLLSSGSVAGYYRIEVLAPGAPVPRLFFSDLQSGPATGGENNLGVFLTLYGEGFGAERGHSTVTVGGREVARYVLWTQDGGARGLDLITVQLGPDVQSGELLLPVNGRSSNALTFTVRPGAIYFVMPEAAAADDANPGTFERPFKTVYRARESLQAGDTVYLRGGRISSFDPWGPGWDTLLMLDASGGSARGTAERPIAYIGYPGQSPVLGAPTARRGILLATDSTPQTHYVLANLSFTQTSNPLALSGTGHRIIGNTVIEAGYDDSGTVSVTGDSSHLAILGNRLLRNGQAGVKFHHGFYIGGFGTNRFIEFAWNEVRDQRGGRAIQLFGHLDHDWMDDIHIHHNWLAGSELDNAVIGGSDGTSEVIGRVRFDNNISSAAGGAGVRIDDSRGMVAIEHNTLHANRESQLRLQRIGPRTVVVRNNILAAPTGGAYYAFDAGTATPIDLVAEHNLCDNAGPCPAWDIDSIQASPRFVNADAGDYRLGAGSPAIGAGVPSDVPTDFVGTPRPHGGGWDVGAYEYEFQP